MPWTVDVAVSDATLYYDKLYTYAIPPHLEGRVYVGSMVLVPFGRGAARPRIGVVMALQQADALDGRTKELYDAAPEDARLTAELLAIVNYLKEATFCTYYEAVKAVIPYGAQYTPERTEAGWRLKNRLSRTTEAVYSVAEMPKGQAPAKKPTPKQQKVLELLQESPKTRQEILDACGVGRGVVDTLEKNGLVKAQRQDKAPGLVGALHGPAHKEAVPHLSPEQQRVADALRGHMQEKAPKPALLHGVTGSGKTPVFLHLIQAALDKGKTALVLVPEIGLTPQMLGALRDAFGARVAVQHSGLSNTQRLLQWRQIQRGEAGVVVGTRSAVFAPLESIGLIVVDEEQERTYQSENAPRYDALEVAKRRARLHGALLLLASATPSVADYYAAETNRYTLYTLSRRYGDLPLPAVELVDMRVEAAAGSTAILSEVLAGQMEKNLQSGRQAILLLNRRGYRTVGMCRECGEVLKCDSCSVPMVYHKAGDRLLCHYCGHSISPVPQVCPQCGGEMRYTGFGTQRVEEELAQRFPKARVLRMDLDSTQRRGSHTEMLAGFGRGEYDILLGTQMVAKGLDFEKVSLVGVIGIDSLLYGQGYRAYENVFSLVTQVVGRSGRAGAPGKALIQTMDVQNPVLRLAAAQDYEAFYRLEVEFRRLAMYPPFCTLCQVGFVAETETDAVAAARRFAALLAQQAARQPGLPLRILGPAPMHVMQVARVYRWRLTLKCRADAGFRTLAKQALAAYNDEGWPRRASVYLDFHADGSG